MTDYFFSPTLRRRGFLMAKIHTTIGIYCNGSFKVNGVKDEDLANHIEYNKTFRFGRALVVDNEIVYQGYMKKEEIEKVLKENKLDQYVLQKCTAPYQ